MDNEQKYTQEQKDNWCKDNDFPLGFFEMLIEQRREEVYKWSKRNPYKPINEHED